MIAAFVVFQQCTFFYLLAFHNLQYYSNTPVSFFHKKKKATNARPKIMTILPSSSTSSTSGTTRINSKRGTTTILQAVDDGTNQDAACSATTTTNFCMEEILDRLVQKLSPRLLSSNPAGSDPSSSTASTSTTSSRTSNNRQYWIGIAGGPGSGKSTVAHAMAQRLNALVPNSTCVIGMDGWHYSQSDLLNLHGEEGMRKRGAPFTFDVEKMIVDITKAKATGHASLPVYDRGQSNPVMDGIQLKPHHQIVLVEGLYLLWKEDPQWKRLAELWDEAWFVKAPSRDIQIERLVARSSLTWTPQKATLWGAGVEGARKRALVNDVPNMDLVEPCIDHADEIIITK